MKRVKSRGVNEIKIKLLPEKAKRDYVLRLVSSVIILTFVIINFLVVYIPLSNYNGQLNELKSKNASKNLELLDLQNKYNFFYKPIYNKNDGTIKDLLYSQLDFNQILLMFNDQATYVDLHDNLSYNDQIKPENNTKIKPTHSFVESIQFTEADLSFTIAVQFDSLDDLTSYENQLNRIQYVSSVEVGNYTNVPINEEEVRWKTTFKITIDPNSDFCPKVGDSSDE